MCVPSTGIHRGRADSALFSDRTPVELKSVLVYYCFLLFVYYKNTQSCYALIPQGILLVYDITNGWSFDGIDRWIREIDEVISTHLMTHCVKFIASLECTVFPFYH